MPKTKRKELMKVYVNLFRQEEYKNEFIINKKFNRKLDFKMHETLEN